jgi:hypothetical protein
MPYAVLADVQGLVAQFAISASSVPNSTQVTTIIDDTSDEIDVRLAAAGYTAPATAPPYFLDWLGHLNAYGAAAAVLKSAFPDATGPGDTPAYAFWEARYQAGLKAITDGTAIPDGVVGSSPNVITPSTYFTRNPEADEAIGAIAEPAFTRRKVF